MTVEQLMCPYCKEITQIAVPGEITDINKQQNFSAAAGAFYESREQESVPCDGCDETFYLLYE
jgi:hypothetical protein